MSQIIHHFGRHTYVVRVALIASRTSMFGHHDAEWAVIISVVLDMAVPVSIGTLHNRPMLSRVVPHRELGGWRARTMARRATAGKLHCSGSVDIVRSSEDELAEVHTAEEVDRR